MSDQNHDELRNHPDQADEAIHSREIDADVRAGEVTGDEAAELLQQAERRRAAEEGPTLDTDADGTVTQGGFGAGQGMQKQRTGQGPSG